MNDDMAKTLAILMEELINQMVLLRHELERDRNAHTRALDADFIMDEFARIGAALANQPGPEMISEPANSAEAWI